MFKEPFSQRANFVVYKQLSVVVEVYKLTSDGVRVTWHCVEDRGRLASVPNLDEVVNAGANLQSSNASECCLTSEC